MASGSSDSDIYYTVRSGPFTVVVREAALVTVGILIAAIISPLALNFGSSDQYTSEWGVRDERTKEREGNTWPVWVLLRPRGDLHKWAGPKQMGRGSGRGLTNATRLPNDPVGWNAGRTPKTVPAATWNCPGLTHISFNRLTLVFLLFPRLGRFIQPLIMIQRINIRTGLPSFRGHVWLNCCGVYCESSFVSNREHLIYLLFRGPLL